MTSIARLELGFSIRCNSAKYSHYSDLEFFNTIGRLRKLAWFCHRRNECPLSSAYRNQNRLNAVARRLNDLTNVLRRSVEPATRRRTSNRFVFCTLNRNSVTISLYLYMRYQPLLHRQIILKGRITSRSISGRLPHVYLPINTVCEVLRSLLQTEGGKRNVDDEQNIGNPLGCTVFCTCTIL